MDRMTAIPVAAIICLVLVTGCTGTGILSGNTTTPPDEGTPPVTAIATVMPATIATLSDPYPQARGLGENFSFGTGKVASVGTVYRYWINDTYHWHNDMDNHYYTEPDRPQPGYKYLFVFVQMINTGDTRVWYPPSANIVVHYNGVTYTRDENHFIPDKARSEDETPVEIEEIQYFGKRTGEEYVEDFGYSRGTTSYFLYPGTSNSLDGYIVYRVPASLSPEKTVVEIPFNGQDTGFWRLA
jgi:hypothetical protein